MAVASFGDMRLPQKTLNSECRQFEIMAIVSLGIFPLARSIKITLCRKISASFFSSRGRAPLNKNHIKAYDPTILELDNNFFSRSSD